MRLKIYGNIESGNCYKVKQLVTILGLEHEWVHLDVLAGDTRTPAYLAMNALGKVPLLDLGDGRYLSESNAILNYLASGTELLPDDRFERARVLQWQFFEQFSHEPPLATARVIKKYFGLPEARRAEYERLLASGYKALAIMETQLGVIPYLAGGRFTIADISLYGYTHTAEEGGFDLVGYPAIRAWLARVAEHPGAVVTA